MSFDLNRPRERETEREGERERKEVRPQEREEEKVYRGEKFNFFPRKMAVPCTWPPRRTRIALFSMSSCTGIQGSRYVRARER